MLAISKNLQAQIMLSRQVRTSMQSKSINLKKTAKNEHLSDSKLGEFNMETLQSNLQLMDPYFKPVHARVYIVLYSLKQRLQQSKEIVRLVDIGVLGEDYSYEWASLFPKFGINKKMEQ
jgi:hypothetical protein